MFVWGNLNLALNGGRLNERVDMMKEMSGGRDDVSGKIVTVRSCQWYYGKRWDIGEKIEMGTT